jgi:uroporphyrinogen-III synthase
MTRLVVITRPKSQAGPIAAALAERGFAVLIEPMLDIVALDEPLPALDRFGALAFSSANAVVAVADRIRGCHLPVYTVGGSTAAALRDAGFGDIRTGPGDAEGLAALIHDSYDGRRPILHLSGREVARELSPLLRSAAIAVERVAVYDAVAADHLSAPLAAALYARTIDSVLFFSARTAGVFGTLAVKSGLDGMTSGISALCLSAAVARQASALRWRAIGVAARPTTDAMIALLAPIPYGARGSADG